MRHFLLSLAILTLATSIMAQSPQTFKYQAVIRNSNGEIISNQNISFRISILQGSAVGAIHFTENHNAIINDFGLVNFEIGNGSPVTGTLDGINWASGPFFLQIEIDETGGTNYQLMGTSQLLSVPYALYAGHSSDATWNKNSFDLYYDDGKVGIGKINPSFDLDVTGIINTDGNYSVNGNKVLSIVGKENVIIGKGAGGNNIGSQATLIGDSAGYHNQGSFNLFVGMQAGYQNSSGSLNTFLGSLGGYSNTIGTENTYIGNSSGISNIVGSFNTFLGCFTGLSNKGSGNIFLGHSSGGNNSTGLRNTFIGTNTGVNNSGDKNVFIGYNAGYNETGSNKLIIANGEYDENTLIYADFVSGNLGIGTKILDHKLNINGNAEFKGEDDWDEPGDQAKLFLGDPNHGLNGIYGEGLRFWTFDDPSHDIRFQNHTGTDYMTIKMSTGNVGIGTTDPATLLHIAGPDLLERGQLCITDTDGDDPFLTFYENNIYRAHLGYSNGTGYLSTIGSSNLIIQGYATNTGNVGIGWDIESDIGKQITKTKDGKGTKDVSHKLTILNSIDNYALRLIGPYGGYGYGARLNFGDGDLAFIEEDIDDMINIYSWSRIALTGGNVGIGTLNPSQKLDIDLGDVIIRGPLSCDEPGEQATLYLGTVHHYLRAEYGYGIKIGTYAAADVLNITEGSGNVGIGTTSPSEKLTVKGNIRVESAATGLPVVELGEGLDYAEGFDLSDSQKIMPGNVLIIDPDNPGELTLSKQAYDSKVAGIVAGANDLGSGVKLGTGQFDCDVALAGRVYCNVDARYGAISPGDLLTTSATPGFAMIVKDRNKANGAILGKAMESLKKGQKGQILVLVTLQ